MNNEETRAVLIAKRNAINKAINDLGRYAEEVKASRWSGAVKSRQKDAIKATAAEGGVDISGWDGKAAPEPETD